jgi:hypothetical protein
MKADAKPTLEGVAAQLGAEGVDWVVDRLRRFRPLVGYPIKGYDDSWDRLALEGAFNLETWLSMEAMASEMIGEDCPEIEDASTALSQLMPLIAQYIHQPGKRGGPTPDNRRWLCAHVCAEIWREFHDTPGPNSDTLLAACEAYWQACDQPPTAADLSGNLRNWNWFLTSNSREKSEVR